MVADIDILFCDLLYLIWFPETNKAFASVHES